MTSPRVLGSTGKKYVTEKPRGWKYGVMNVVPQAPDVVFRGDRFGQFRDMLEQRKYGLVYNVGEGRVDRFSRPVEISFREPAWKTNLTSPGETIAEEPINTHSSNLSLYSTSSLPYFDDPRDAVYPFGRNRSSRTDFPDFIEVTTDE